MKVQIVTAIIFVVVAVQVNTRQTPIRINGRIVKFSKLIKYAALGNNEKVKLLLKNNTDIINEKSHYKDKVGIFLFQIFRFSEGSINFY